MAAKTKTRPQVLEQVRKLLNLADLDKNDSEGEACNALEAAHALLEQHGLDMAEVHVEEKTSWDVEEWMDKPRSQYDSWNRMLGMASGHLFNCQPFTMRRGYNKTNEYRMVSLGYYGEPTDIIMACEVWPWLTKTTRKLARAYAGQGWNSSHRSFAESFATRVWLRVEDMNAADAAKKEAERTVVDTDGGVPIEKKITTALVVAEKKDAITQWLADKGIKFGKSRARGRTGTYDPYAGAAGDEAGRNVNLNFKNQIGKGQNNKHIN